MKHFALICALCVSAWSLSAQTILTAAGLASFGTNAAAGGGGGGGGGSFTLIDHAVAFADSSSTATTPAINTTGAKLLIVAVFYYQAPVTVTDSKGNTLTALTARGNGGTYNTQIFYCIAPSSVGSGHTFSIQGALGYPVITVTAWTYSGTTPALDNENGNTAASGTTLQTGAASSSSGARLVVSSMVYNNTAGSPSLSIDSSFTISDQAQNSFAPSAYLGQAYLLQGSGASVNPTWTLNGGTDNGLAAAIAAFK